MLEELRLGRNAEVNIRKSAQAKSSMEHLGINSRLALGPKIATGDTDLTGHRNLRIHGTKTANMIKVLYKLFFVKPYTIHCKCVQNLLKNILDKWTMYYCVVQVESSSQL
jgi:hypothetical protein